MIYLDTHVVLWLYAGTLEKFTAKGRKLLEENEILISHAVVLELELLHESKRIKFPAKKIIADLQKNTNLQACDISFQKIIAEALTLKWTRDPFDRLIVANALVNCTKLLTKNQIIHKKYAYAVW
jgi:PIN domain nuclease of toxin-antitoxin system